MWKDIYGYEGFYAISEKGEVKSLERMVRHPKGGNKIIRERIKPQFVGSNGYFIVSLNKNGVGCTKTVHRLLAIAFLDNPEGKREVNHKDGNKLNNSLENLEWSTASENRYHAFRMGLQKGPMSMKGRKGKLCVHSKKVYQVLANGDKIEFDSATTAEEKIGISRRGISYCAKGKQDLAGGYKWTY